MALDTSNLESTMDAAAISDGIALRKIESKTTDELIALQAMYEAKIGRLTLAKTLPNCNVGMVDAKIDRLTQKYFLITKYLDSVM
jgi:hypothetical protein